MKIIMNGKPVEVQTGTTILDAAKAAGVRIPTLCYLREINEISACRICLVQVNNSTRLVPACSTRVAEGMIVETENAYVRKARRQTLELIACNHQMECTECPRGADCELRDLMKEYGADDRAYGRAKWREMREESTPYLVREHSRCILCRRCVSACKNLQGIGAISANEKGGRTNIGFPPGLALRDTNCVACGECVAVCPTGALTPRDDTKQVWKALYNKQKTVVVAVTPAAAYSIGRFFGEKEFRDNGPKVASILHQIGFDLVVDAGAWMKEYQELELRKAAERAAAGKAPAISGADQALILYLWQNAPEMAESLLNLPLPAEFIAGKVKEAMPEKEIFFVSVDTALSPKNSFLRQVDAHLTARELFWLIRRACVSNFTAEQVWAELEGKPYDPFPGQGESIAPRNEERQTDTELEVDGRKIRVRRITGLGGVMEALRQRESYELLQVCAAPGGPLYAGGGKSLRSE